ncbi:MAG TPA: hypothetical protein P5309_03835 [Syntrophomonadaceae bacterium]|jgi:hypothetical protein|nr:hypothetical protein [Syntrophomonadaceae bacterium]
MAKRTMEQAIWAYCLDCSNHSKKEVELCRFTKCPLHPFRLKPNQEDRSQLEEEMFKDRSAGPQQTLFD